MRKLISILLILSSIIQFSAVSAEELQTGLSDNTINKLLYLDMISIEMPYRKSNLVTRGEFSTYLFKYLGTSVPNATASYFYDVPKTHEYVHGINYMLDCGYIKKDVSGVYNPESNLTVKDAAMVLLNVLGYGTVLSDSRFELMTGRVYAELISGVESQNEYITVGGLIEMFENALDVNMFSYSGEWKNGSQVYENDKTFMNGYFKIYEHEGRINATALTSMDETVSLYGDYIAIDSVTYKIQDSMTNVINSLGCNVKFYYTENRDAELEILYFEETKTDKLVIKADDFISYNDRRIKYIKEDTNSIKTVAIEPGAIVVYNGLVIDNYTAEIFKIENGSIELVGKNGKYDVVKIYDYKDIVIGGISKEENLLYSKFSDEIYSLDDYNDVIIKDRYGRRVTMEVIEPDMVASLGESDSGDVLLINLSDKKVTGVLNGVHFDDTGTVWTIDGKDYGLSSCFAYNLRPVGASVTVYLNYLGKISGVIEGKTSDMMYGYLSKAYIDDDDSLKVKIYTQGGVHETYGTAEKLTIDSQRYSGVDAIKMLSYESPTSVEPSGTVQPQLIRYRINSAAEVTQIDTARNVDAENEETTLSRNITNQYSMFFTSIQRFATLGDDDSKQYSNLCLVTDETLVFEVPGNVDEAKTELDAYSIGQTLNNEEYYYIDAYDIDYHNGGAASVVVIRLDSVVKVADLGMTKYLVNDVYQTLNKDDEVINAYEIYSLSDGSESTIFDNAVLRTMEKQQIDKGDIISYGLLNNTVTNCEVDFDPYNLKIGATASLKGGNNHHGWQFPSYNRGTVAQIVDITGNYMYCSVSANSKSTMKDCPLVFDTSNINCYVFDKNAEKKQVEKVDSVKLREYTYNNNPNVKVVLYTSLTNLKSIVVYV